MEITQRFDEGIAVLALVGRLTVNDTPGLLKAAAAKAPRVSLGQKVLDLLGTYAPAGLTGEEISTRLSARLNSVTPRFAELRRLGWRWWRWR
jgi:hypothetical protein